MKTERNDRSRTIDIHAHMLPEEAIRRLGKESPRVAPKLIEQPDGTTIMEIAGKVVQRPMPREMLGPRPAARRHGQAWRRRAGGVRHRPHLLL